MFLRHMSRVRPLTAMLIVVTFACGNDADAMQDDGLRATMLGKLRGTSLSVQMDDVPARDAISALATALDLTIIGRWADDQVGHGMQQGTPIELELDHVSGEIALELVLEQCGLRMPCTWQLRNGFVEAGTKERLSAPSAVELRRYDVTDLLLEPPSFAASTNTFPTGGASRLPKRPSRSMLFERHPYRSAALTDRPEGSSMSEAFIELLRGTFAFIEPGNWDVEEVEYLEYELPGNRTRRVPRKIAHVDHFQGQVLMTAPDFMHRQFRDYSFTPVLPDLDEATCAARSHAASSQRCAITVHAHRDVTFTSDELKRRLLGVLLHRELAVEFDQSPAREAFDWLRHQLGIPLIGRYADDPVGHGIDPDLPITLSLSNATALDVLQAMLDQCEASGFPCTWQLRRGFVEFGTKSRLDAPAARELRIYEIGDLIMHIPKDPSDRLPREHGGLDLVQEVVEQVEPGRWDYGQPLISDPPGQVPPIDRAVLDGPDDVARDDNATSSRPATTAVAPASLRSAMPLRYVHPVMPAIIRYWRDLIIIRAPDYVHRQIGGYPDPIPPAES